VTGDARHVLPAVAPPPDVVYLDPMFPERRTSALPSKEIQYLRRLLAGTEGAGPELVAAARECGARRVVVKRPAKGAPLAGPPAFAIEGKLVRYDVYVTGAR
jgi:16S rRNA (guanine1516-N2)-methyltransferase